MYIYIYVYGLCVEPPQLTYQFVRTMNIGFLLFACVCVSVLLLRVGG